MRHRSTTAVAAALALCGSAAFADPVYSVIDLGVLAAGNNSQGNGISPNGVYAVGRNLGTPTRAVISINGAPITGLPNSTTNFATAVGVNDAGVAVGQTSTTAFGSGPLPMSWVGGVQTPLAMPAGQTAGRAYAINGAGSIVGSVGGGVSERAVVWNGGTPSLITATTGNGSYMTTAYGINNAGLIVGNGIDPNNAAVNVGLAYNSGTGTMSSIGALPNMNGALAFAVSNTGYVVGSSMLNQGSGMPFIWSASGGMTAIPLPAGTSSGIARGVNSAGWVVGVASSAFAVPFLYDGSNTYSIASLVGAAPGWDFATNTSSAALGISEDGTVVGSAVYNGAVHAFRLVVSPVPEPGSTALLLAGLAAVGWRASRRRGGSAAA